MTTTRKRWFRLAKNFVEMGFHLVATHGTAEVLEQAGLQPERVYKVKEGRPNVVDLIKGDRIQLIVNTPRGQDTFFDEKAIRRAAVLARIPSDYDAGGGTAAAARGNRGAAGRDVERVCAAGVACGAGGGAGLGRAESLHPTHSR